MLKTSKGIKIFILFDLLKKSNFDTDPESDPELP